MRYPERPLIRWACPVVLTVAAAMKLVEIDRFADSLQTFTLLDRRITGFALFGVPVAECVPLML